jgi:hypothetical protein
MMWLDDSLRMCSSNLRRCPFCQREKKCENVRLKFEVIRYISQVAKGKFSGEKEIVMKRNGKKT